MSLELNLRFPDPDRVIVDYDGEEVELSFEAPITDADLQDLRWYLETYAGSYTTEVDDQRAGRIVSRLKRWGTALYQSVFRDGAIELFIEFRNLREPGRVISISSVHPSILSLPWELLHSPDGAYLFNEKPRISVRRNLSGKRGGRKVRYQPKERARLLFVVSRPTDAGFLNPRTEPQAVLQALESKGLGQIEVEFLRPATLKALCDRLDNEDLPPIDILHFDGHGVFDSTGQLRAQAKEATLPPSLAGFKAEDESGERNGKNQGYLLFEEADGKKALVEADRLGQLLNQQGIGLVLLSACQSAAVAGEEAMGSVAARLTQAGIPSVVAMPYSVLIHTTRDLFATFYENLVQRKGIGASLDNARRRLMTNPKRGERQRGQDRIPLNLEDWFIPNLYQSGVDTPLLIPPSPPYQGGDERQSPPAQGENAPQSPPYQGGLGGSNLPPAQESGFHGRTRELWQIERAFVRGTHRITLHGFGGQGKTALACEAARWLQRTGMFQRICFVDYNAFQGEDAVSLAVAALSTVLEQSLLDADAATAALHRTPTLLILDNLETLERPTDQPQPLTELLTAATAWSEAGQSRVLLTTRSPNLHHPAYPTEGSLRHVQIPLTGLGSEHYPHDALAYFQSLMQLPPAPQFGLPNREALINLFKLVDFHPLSIALLARQLKTRRIAEVGTALERLLADTSDTDPTDSDAKNKSLIASINLSLDRLDGQAQQLINHLGVFQGGAMEPDLLEITEFSEAEWQSLRAALESTGLIQPEAIPGVNSPYLKFHPTLAPLLWSRLSDTERQALLSRHRQRYYTLSGYLYTSNPQNPHEARAIARRELPNLLFAVRGALDAGDENAVDFVDSVNRFLYIFGMNRDRATLTQRAEQLAGAIGSQAWVLSRSNTGEQLWNAGRYAEAAQVFAEILSALGNAPSYNRCITLGWLGRCFRFLGQLGQAAQCYREALAVAEQLEQSDGVKRQTGALQTDLADVLTDMGDFAAARTAYETALAIDEELGGNPLGTAITKGQLGTLALMQNNLPEAEQRYRDALATFQRLNEPAAEAIYWHQLGRVYEEAGRVYKEAKVWEQAEQAYRRSAELKESQGMLTSSNGVVATWNQLAVVNELAGKAQEAEGWYRKAIEGGRSAGDRLNASKYLSNLANLLQQQPHRLAEAHQLAEEALAIKQTLDPSATEIWTTYNILAEISEKQQQPDAARAYRKQARQAKAAYKGTQYELKPFAGLIVGVVAALEDADTRQQLEAALPELEQRGWQKLVTAIRQILAGERDEDTLCDSLDPISNSAMIVLAILRGIADPSSLQAFTGEASSS